MTGSVQENRTLRRSPLLTFCNVARGSGGARPPIVA